MKSSKRRHSVFHANTIEVMTFPDSTKATLSAGLTQQVEQSIFSFPSTRESIFWLPLLLQNLSPIEKQVQIPEEPYHLIPF